MGHALMENRNSLVVGAVTTRASGHAERLVALALIEPYAECPQPITLGADKGYDAGEFLMELRNKAVTPHVAQNQQSQAISRIGCMTERLDIGRKSRFTSLTRAAVQPGPPIRKTIGQITTSCRREIRKYTNVEFVTQ
jgi:hypothetical protein